MNSLKLTDSTCFRFPRCDQENRLSAPFESDLHLMSTRVMLVRLTFMKILTYMPELNYHILIILTSRFSLSVTHNCKATLLNQHVIRILKILLQVRNFSDLGAELTIELSSYLRIGLLRQEGSPGKSHSFRFTT